MLLDKPTTGLVVLRRGGAPYIRGLLSRMGRRVRRLHGRRSVRRHRDWGSENQSAVRCSQCGPNMTGNSATRSMLALCTIILSAAACYLPRSILAPVAFSIFAMKVVWPSQRALKARMQKLLAL